jgi:hypothetical protein
MGMVFSTGFNFFTWDNDIGVDDRDEKAFLPGARAAWARLGQAYMATWKPDPDDGEMPWAWSFFGDPSRPLKRPRKLVR